MNLRDVDLNLLVVLDVLLEERQVVSAARRLGIAQPSASAALERARKLFDDPLLVRVGRGMELTSRGLALRGPIRDIIERTQTLLDRAPAELATVERVVRLVCSDIPAVTLLKAMWRRLERTAPGIRLVLLQWRDSDQVLDALARDQADLAISLLPQTGIGFRRTVLSQQDYCVAMRRDHPASARFDLDQWLSFPQVIVSSRAAMRTPLDDRLALLGRARHVAMSVPSLMMVPMLLADSDLMAMLPRYCKHMYPDLHYCDPPLPVEGFPLHLATAVRNDRDIAVHYVAKLIRAHFSEQEEPDSTHWPC